MKEYYKIGEISTLYGIGTDSLRYSEHTQGTALHRLFHAGNQRTSPGF